MALKHSADLFTKDGAPLSFMLRPCEEKRRLKPLIVHGGGLLSSKGDSDAIRLAVEGSAVGSEECISTRYIKDCVRENKLLDLNIYRLSKTGRVDTSVYDLDEDDLSPAKRIIKTVARERKGRKKFSRRDDMNMIKFLIEERRCNELKGNVVWRDMETLKVTDHSFQSMKDRFRKIVLPNLNQYCIHPSWVSAITGVTSDAKRSPFSIGLQRLIKSSSPPGPLASSLTRTAVVTGADLLSSPKDNLRSSPNTRGSPTKQIAKSAVVSDIPPRGSPRKKSTPKQSKGDNSHSHIDTSDEEDEFDRELYKLAVNADSTNVHGPLSKSLSDAESPGHNKEKDLNSESGQQSLNVSLGEGITSSLKRKRSHDGKNRQSATTCSSDGEDGEDNMDTGDTGCTLRSGLHKRPYKDRGHLPPVKHSEVEPNSPAKAPHKENHKISPVRSRSTSPVKTPKGRIAKGKSRSTDDDQAEVSGEQSQADQRSKVKRNYKLRSETTNPVKESSKSGKPEKLKERMIEIQDDTSSTDEEYHPGSKQVSSESTDSNDSDESPPNRLKKCEDPVPGKRADIRSRSAERPKDKVKPDSSNILKSPLKSLASTSKSNGSLGNKRTGPSRKNHSLTDFIMDQDDLASSQESQPLEDEAEENSLEDDLSEDIPAISGDVKKYCMVVKKLSRRFGLNPSEVLYAMWANSGCLRNTIHWILFGVNTQGRPAWTEDDDRIVVESASPEEIDMLRKRYGSQNADERAVFLEDSCFK